MERVAVVGSRKGADHDAVLEFIRALWAKHPDSILVSGGASGVDQIAEQGWLALGGRVESFRPTQLGERGYGVEKWELGGPEPRVYVLLGHPDFADYKSAALYRDCLIAEAADRLVAFMRPGGSRGAGLTAEVAEGYGKPTHRWGDK